MPPRCVTFSKTKQKHPSSIIHHPPPQKIHTQPPNSPNAKQELDRDGSGTLTREDFLQLLHNNKENDNGANGGTTTASTIISGGDGEGSAEGVVSRVPSSVSFASAGAGAGVDLEGGELEVAVAVEK